MDWIQSPYCNKCGHPFYGKLIGGRDCPNCLSLQPTFQKGRAAFLLAGGGRRLIHALKYRGITAVLKDLPLLLEQAPGYLSFLENAVLVPVPLHRRRHRSRGFNQAALIARAVAQIIEGAVVSDLLIRTRNTPTQTELPRERRIKNVKNAFAPKPEAVIEVDRRFVLMDDVITTGATLEACCLALRKAGAKHVDVAALGHG